jgi:hypothetical protein
MIHRYFDARLRGRLDAETAQLEHVLSAADMGRLAAAVPQGEKILLVLRNDGCCAGPLREEVEASNTDGATLWLSRRGLGGTARREFPRGSRLYYEVTAEAVKDLVCNHDCCADQECPKVPAAVAGTSLPAPAAGTPWSGTVVFAGTAPLEIGHGPLPGWLSAETGPNWLRLEGTPPDGVPFRVSVAATNNPGGGMVVESWLISPAT